MDVQAAQSCHLKFHLHGGRRPEHKLADVLNAGLIKGYIYELKGNGFKLHPTDRQRKSQKRFLPLSLRPLFPRSRRQKSAEMYLV